MQVPVALPEPHVDDNPQINGDAPISHTCQPTTWLLLRIPLLSRLLQRRGLCSAIRPHVMNNPEVLQKQYLFAYIISK